MLFRNYYEAFRELMFNWYLFNEGSIFELKFFSYFLI